MNKEKREVKNKKIKENQAPYTQFLTFSQQGTT